MSNWLNQMPGATTLDRQMPDIASVTDLNFGSKINWVGMKDIELPLWLLSSGHSFRTPAKAEAYVSLDDANARGIHMSRLFINLQEIITANVLSPAMVQKALTQFLASHTGISNSSLLRLKFDYMVERNALVSGNKGWRGYPVEIVGQVRDGELSLELHISLLYSSTCPCSAALARQLIQEQFSKDFDSKGAMISSEDIKAWLGSEKGILATPHSQRSEAKVKVVLNTDELSLEFPILPLIDLLEGSLKTPVQAAVKREDEQEFAKLNGQNLMFCEDAARRMKAALETFAGVKDYWIQARHIESLHPHDAVAQIGRSINESHG